MEEKEQEMVKIIRTSPWLRRFMDTAVAGIFYTYYFINYRRFSHWTPEQKKWVFDKRRRIGLREGTIFANTLYAPAKNGDLTCYSSVAGRLSGYDFIRRAETPVEEQMDSPVNGRIVAFPIPEILNNPIDSYTPSGIVDPLRASDILIMENASLDQVLEWEFAREINYETAYKTVDMLAKYGFELEERNLLEQEIFQVTPKGNGLLYLFLDGGTPAPKKEKKLVLEPFYV